MLAEAPPSTDAAFADGSTMISAQLLKELRDDVEVDLVYFHGARDAADQDALTRTRSVRRLRQRTRRSATLAQPLTRLPRANWQRHVSRRELRAMAADADVVYAHGLHVLHLALRIDKPLVAHEVDPWSQYWRQRGLATRGPQRWYDLVQSARAARLERAVARSGATLVVVNERDAAWLRSSTGGRVEALANGVDRFDAAPDEQPAVPADPVLAFVGTLDYPPNVEALNRLATEVWPLVRARVPDARLVVAGRHAPPEVRALATDGIEVVGEVDDVSAVFRGARASLYPGRTGRGTKNSVSESLVAGCPVVASVESARGQEPGDHLLVADASSDLADLAVSMLTDEDAARRARAACLGAGAATRTWAQAAEQWTACLRRAAEAGPARRPTAG